MTREKEMIQAANERICFTAQSANFEKIAFIDGAKWADAHPKYIRSEEEIQEYIKIMQKARWLGSSLEYIIRNTIMWADQHRPKGGEE